MKKNGKAKTFKIVDAGMNDLIRPALYQGYHEIIPVREYPPNPASQRMSWVPSVNPETSSPKTGTCRTCARRTPGRTVRRSLWFSMSSNYNSRPMAEEVLVDGDQWNVIRSRQSWEDLIRGESIPE